MSDFDDEMADWDVTIADGLEDEGDYEMDNTITEYRPVDILKGYMAQLDGEVQELQECRARLEMDALLDTHALTIAISQIDKRLDALTEEMREYLM